jgi:hypothetical protein
MTRERGKVALYSKPKIKRHNEKRPNIILQSQQKLSTDPGEIDI